MRVLQLLGTAAITTILAAYGCGGTAIIDSPMNEGGTGGTSSGTSTGSGTGAGTSTGTGGIGGTGPGGPVQQGCQRFCEAVEGCAAYPNCVPECMADVSNECVMEYLALLNCASSNMGPPMCEFPDICTGQLVAWSTCEEGEEPPPPNPCGPMGCAVGNDGSCTCQVSCPEASYQVDCRPSGPTNDCSCQINGEIVGGCSDPSQQACEPFSGCCADLFFGLDG